MTTDQQHRDIATYLYGPDALSRAFHPAVIVQNNIKGAQQFDADAYAADLNDLRLRRRMAENAIFGGETL